ncbi:MAG: hypothetical protein AUJ23_03820 [Candidatus Magasanikbacteria bacterium CG1_02_32_51]|uniref:Uncharacterized protein n=1 Tax=Candidatus Magasanikbacteria bacterium CG1_02_32_51 TaxID=1805238 RepID=A0A1J4U1L1_9BACT|nr:MAG: hypothetical protein AUJ23_03820 [Candidatus Magasanikbacteria bacterium CG1_02_32_51]
MQKKIFLTLVLIFLLIPKTSFAALDQRCWLEEDCKKFRETFGSVDAIGGFYSADLHMDAKEACKTGADGKDFTGRNIGFCLPAGETVTSISFGGRTKFSNIGEFIKFIYQYAFIIGSVIAVMVIIVAGVMYIFSGGNSDTVGQAKKKIYGAITGLVLMALSFTILKTINPYLVELRLPSIWAINTSGIAPVNCESLDQGPKKVTMIALAKNQSATTPPTDLASAKFFIPDSTTADKTSICGNDYYVNKTGGQTCGGNSCLSDGQVCYQKPIASSKACNTANIAGIVYSSSVTDNFVQKNTLAIILSTVFGEGWEWKWLTDDGKNDIDIKAVCKNGKLEDLSIDTKDPSEEIYINSDKLIQEFFSIIPPSKINHNYCSGDGEIKGFVLFLSINEEGSFNNDEHYFGIDRATGQAIDLADDGDDLEDDLFISTGTGISMTDFFLSPALNIALKPYAKPAAQVLSKNIIDKYLIKAEELKKGIYFHIDIDKICDVDNLSDFTRCYAKFGYSPPK